MITETKAKIKTVMVFGLQIAVFDEAGHQVPELQESVVQLFAAHMERCGYNPEGTIVESPVGQWWRIFKTSEGNWNWKEAQGDEDS